MILQLKILFRILLKNLMWLLIFFIIACFYFIYLTITYTPEFPTTLLDIVPFTGYPLDSYNSMQIIVVVYQSALLIYIVYSFLHYDFRYSFENIILRTNPKKWLFFKSLLSYLFIAVVRCSLFMITRELFYDYFILPYDYLLSVILISFIVNSFLLFNLNFNQYINIVLWIIEIPLTIHIFHHLTTFNGIIIILVITIFNFIYFKLKRLAKNNYFRFIDNIYYRIKKVK